jgi:hypothetical protein
MAGITVWSDNTLIAANGSVQSGFADVSVAEELRIMRTATAGTYAFEIDWSRDGVAVDLTETVSVPNQGRATVRPSAPYARFRVKNTDAVLPFTAHRTTVFAR